MKKLALVCVAVAGCAVEEPPSGVTSSAETVYDCMTVGAGQGFVSIPIENATVLDTLTFDVTPSGPVDAVIGMSAGIPTSFNSLATIARLNPSGYADVRDGDTYRADFQYAYGTNPVSMRMIADLTTHTYSVEIAYSDSPELARQYHFRTQQAAVTHLDHLGVIVDSPSGSVRVCPYDAASVGVRYTREGAAYGAALPNGQAVIVDGSTLTTVDAGGHALATATRTGQVFADTSGSVFVASVSGTTLSLEKLSSSLASQWVRTRTIPDGNVLTAYNGDGAGGAVVATWNQAADSVTVFRFQSNGTYSGSHSTKAGAVAVDGNNAFVVRSTDTTVKVTKFSAAWTTLWSRTFNVSAPASTAATSPDGSVSFGGTLVQPSDFGGGPLFVSHPSEDIAQNNYIVHLDANGQHVFSQRLDTLNIGRITSNGHWIVVSATRYPQMHYPRLFVFGMTGGIAPDAPVIDTGLGQLGEGFDVSLAADGKMYWQAATGWPGNSGMYSYFFAL